MPWVIIIILILILGPFLYLGGIVIYRRIVRRPGPPIIDVFLDSPLRRRMQPPEKIIQMSTITPGMTVLEIGCGSGAITPYLARAASPSGKVFALDIQQEMLDIVHKKLARKENRDIKNVTTILSSAYELPFENHSIDVVTYVAALPEVPDPVKALHEVRRVLKPAGRLVIAEIIVDPEYPMRRTTLKWGRKAGFEPEHVSGNFWHYNMRFVKSTG